MLVSRSVLKFLHHALPYPAQGFRFDANITGKLVLGDALKYVRSVLEQIEVALLGRVGQKGGHDFLLLAEEDFHDCPGDGFKPGKIFKHSLSGLFITYDHVSIFIADEIML